MDARRGRFVALEGIDGAGKTTAATAAAKVLRKEGYEAVAAGRALTDGASSYLAGHMAALRKLIWEEPPDAPYLELGDDHWVHLQAAWYHGFARCVVMPLVRAGSVVIVDTWGHKFLAKLQLRPPGAVDIEHARAVFAMVPQPDLVVLLRTDARLAATRKAAMSGSETGNREGAPDLSEQAFSCYQGRLGRALEGFASRLGWTDLDTAGLGTHETGIALADAIERHINTTGVTSTKETRA